MSMPRVRHGSLSSTLLAWISFGAAFLPQAGAQRGALPGDTPQRPPSPDLEIPRAPVLEPSAALRSFVLPPGFRIELVAAEPLVQDAVMMTFNGRGRIWIAELPAYNFELLRIYRIVYDGRKRGPRPDFALLEPPNLVERLTDDNGWTRDAAQRLIVESGNAELVPARVQEPGRPHLNAWTDAELARTVGEQ